MGTMFMPKVTELVRQGRSTTPHERQRRLIELSLLTRPVLPGVRWDERTRTLSS